MEGTLNGHIGKIVEGMRECMEDIVMERKWVQQTDTSFCDVLWSYISYTNFLKEEEHLIMF